MNINSFLTDSGYIMKDPLKRCKGSTTCFKKKSSFVNRGDFWECYYYQCMNSKYHWSQ